MPVFAQLRTQLRLSQINTGVHVTLGNLLWFGVLNLLQQTCEQSFNRNLFFSSHPLYQEGETGNKSPCKEAQYWFQLYVYMRIISGHTIRDTIAKSNYFSSPLLKTQTYQTALK